MTSYALINLILTSTLLPSPLVLRTGSVTYGQDSIISDNGVNSSNTNGRHPLVDGNRVGSILTSCLSGIWRRSINIAICRDKIFYPTNAENLGYSKYYLHVILD